MVVESSEQAMKSLSRLPDNRYCVDCGRKGIQQCVDLTHHTFLCTQCASIHLKHSDIIKTINMSNFNDIDVKSITQYGNKHHKSIYLANYLSLQYPPPSLDIDDIKAMERWINDIYIHKKWYSNNKSNNNANTQSNKPAQQFNQNTTVKVSYSTDSSRRNSGSSNVSNRTSNNKHSNNTISINTAAAKSFNPSTDFITGSATFNQADSLQQKQYNNPIIAMSLPSDFITSASIDGAVITQQIYNTLLSAQKQYNLSLSQITSISQSAVNLLNQSNRSSPPLIDDADEYNPFTTSDNDSSDETNDQPVPQFNAEFDAFGNSDADFNPFKSNSPINNDQQTSNKQFDLLS